MDITRYIAMGFAAVFIALGFVAGAIMLAALELRIQRRKGLRDDRGDVDPRAYGSAGAGTDGRPAGVDVRRGGVARMGLPGARSLLSGRVRPGLGVHTDDTRLGGAVSAGGGDGQQQGGGDVGDVDGLDWFAPFTAAYNAYLWNAENDFAKALLDESAREIELVRIHSGMERRVVWTWRRMMVRTRVEWQRPTARKDGV